MTNDKTEDSNKSLGKDKQKQGYIEDHKQPRDYIGKLHLLSESVTQKGINLYN